MTYEPTPSNVTDFHREVSLALLRSTPAFAVRTPRGQKDPGAIHWDPKTNNREKSNKNIAELERTTDNLGIHLFGPVVDVDIDTDSPFMTAALDYFLPPTAHVWGRKSRPRTHRLYELAGANAAFEPTAYPFLAKIQSHEATAIEVRGGNLKSGRYSLLPGSLHPSGEYYTWHDVKAARSTPVQVDVTRLMEGVRLACVAALIAPHWVEGVRNELCKAICGFMWRASQYASDLSADAPFDRDAARRLLEGILHITDDDEADRGMRFKTFDATWEKAEAGAPIVGATKLTEITGDDKMLPLLYTLLAHTPDLQQLDELFEQFVVLRNTTNVVDLALGARGNYVMNKESFVFTLGGRYLNSEKGRVPISLIFLNSLQRVIVDQLSIDPEQPKIYVDHDGLMCANIWSGWAIPPCDEEVTRDDVAPVLDYLMEVVCRDDEALYNWVLMWLADIFQHPSQKPGTMLVLVGEQGAGKSLLCENVLRPIIGNAHFTKVSTIEKLTSKFNSHMSGRLVIQGEEVLNSNRRMDAEAMKDMVTSRVRSIEFKGRDVFEMVDHARYILTSNHEDNAVNVGKGDRRQTIVHVSDKYAYLEGKNEARRKPFWKRLFQWLVIKGENGDDQPNKENLAKLHRYFLGVKIDKETIRVAHETQIKRATRVNSTRGMDAWLMSMLEMSNPFDTMRESDRGMYHSFVFKGNKFSTTNGWPEYVQYSKLEQVLSAYTSRDYGEKKSAQQIARYFKDHNMIRDTNDSQVRLSGERVRIRPFPSREAITEYLERMGYPVLQSSKATDDHDEEQDDGPQF